MKKDQRYQPIGNLVDDNGANSDNRSRGSHFESRAERTELGDDGILFQERLGPYNSNNRLDHPLQNGADPDGTDHLRMRRQQSSPEKVVVFEGLSTHLEGNHHHQGNGRSKPPRPMRLGYDKNSNTEVSSSSDDEDGNEGDAVGVGGGNESRGEDGSGLFPASHASSFDLLDDEDEINLQRYHRDFGAFQNNDFYDDAGWDNEYAVENSTSMYHPRTESNGSHSKDPWIRMVQHQNHHSPTHAGNAPFPSFHTLTDLLLYLQRVRRQARQRRAQRLLTMPSEQWWERLQFFVLTYCWDATDVGLLVLAVLLFLWFTGLLWLTRMKGRETEFAQGTQTHNGAEYNGNAEFDEYQQDGRSWRIMIQWWWRVLGIVLLVRILGPFVIHNVNIRRRERRRQRFMSGNIQDQQRRMQQQQLPTIMQPGSSEFNDASSGSHDSPNYDLSLSNSQEGGISGVEIKGTRSGTDRLESSVTDDQGLQGQPISST